MNTQIDFTTDINEVVDAVNNETGDDNFEASGVAAQWAVDSIECDTESYIDITDNITELLKNLIDAGACFDFDGTYEIAIEIIDNENDD